MFDKNDRAFGLFKLGDARSALQELGYTHPASRGYHWYLLAARCHLSLGNLPHAYHLLSSIPSWEHQYATLIF
ncbi:hypothetical protein NL526_27855, partial [Klebsiella pneumoniae]|nr:hypothetical protein [Klebsiella pneumoniae]